MSERNALMLCQPAHEVPFIEPPGAKPQTKSIVHQDPSSGWLVY